MSWTVSTINVDTITNSSQIRKLVILKENSILKPFINCDVIAYFYWGESPLIDMNSRAHLIFPSITKKDSKGECLSLVDYIKDDFTYKDNSMTWLHDPTINRLLDSAHEIFAKVKFTLESNPSQNDKMLDESPWQFDKNFWIFMKKSDQRAFKLKNLNI